MNAKKSELFNKMIEAVIAYKEPYCEDTWVVYSPENDFEETVARFGNVYKLIDWLNEKGE